MTSMRKRLSTSWSRAKQITGEKLGKAEKTQFDETFDTLATHMDTIKADTEHLVKATSILLQPNPNRRMEASVYARLKRAPKAHINELENLGNAFTQSSEAYEGEEFGEILAKMGEVELSIGARFSSMSKNVEHRFIGPLKKFVQDDLRHAANERKELNSARVDLDVAKTRLKKSTVEQQQQSEATLMETQTRFDETFEKVKYSLDKTKQRHREHSGVMLAMLKAQHEYFLQSALELQELITDLETNHHVQEAVPQGTHDAKPLHEELGLDDQVTSVVRARVLVNRDAQSASEVSLTASEIVNVYPNDTTVPDGWVMIERDGLKGMVPKDCLDYNEW